MRHRKTGRKFNRDCASRRALMRNLATSLVLHGRIQTTLARAKELKPIADRLITMAKRGDLAARRRAAGWLYTAEAVRKLFADYPQLYTERNGGYTRIIKGADRPGDGAQMNWIEYVDYAKLAPAAAPAPAKGEAKASGKKGAAEPAAGT